MAVRKDRGRLCIEFQQGGVRVFKRCPPGVTKAQAQELETKLRRELFNRDELGHQADLTLQGAIGLWLHDNRRKNQKQAISEAKQWEPWLKGKLLKNSPEVAAEAVQSWTKLRALRAVTSTNTGYAREASFRPPKHSTINRRLMLLKAVCKWAWRKRLIPENLSPRIQTLREPPHKEIYLSRQEVSTLAAAASTPAVSSAIWLLAYTGMRASELLSLTRPARGASTFYVAQSKSGKPRSVPIVKQLSSHLSALPLELSYWELRKQFIVARKRAGLPREVTLHTLRHTFASWLLAADVDLYTVSRLLGHSSIYTTQRYAHLAQKQLKKAVARLR